MKKEKKINFFQEYLKLTTTNRNKIQKMEVKKPLIQCNQEEVHYFKKE